MGGRGMGSIKRAFISITRNSGKSFILLLVVFLLGNVMAGAVSVYRAIDLTEKNIYEQTNVMAVIDLDYDRMNREVEDKIITEEQYYKIQELQEYRPTPEIIKKIGALPTLKSFDYSSGLFFWQRDSASKNTGEELKPVYAEGAGYHIMKTTQFTEPVDFLKNKVELVSGRFFSDEEINNAVPVIIVSKAFAELNSLQVGSFATFDTVIYKELEFDVPEDQVAELFYAEENVAEKIATDFEIIGIYEPAAESTGKQSRTSMVNTEQVEQELSNLMYTPNAIWEYIVEMNERLNELHHPGYNEGNSAPQYETFFILNNYNDIEKFRAEAEPLLPDYNKLTFNTDFVKPYESSMKSMQSIASMILYIAIGATVITLALVVLLFLRDRKQEMGIYISLGEKKLKVVWQVFLEVLMVFIVAVSLSLVTGNLAASSISERMVENQIAAAQERELTQARESREMQPDSMSILHNMGYSDDYTAEDFITGYGVALDGTVALMFYLAGFLVIVVSTTLPAIYILRLNPKKILME
ncbi:MAG TPA: hypothetical protein DEQ02_08455 [Ruminococcaceae bacterium]|nr:hypothetical protein [Oscillospiraceae bacterium]